MFFGAWYLVEKCGCGVPYGDKTPLPLFTVPAILLLIMKNSPLQDHRKSKKKRGAQKGNQNAHKHGFYSPTLSPQEVSAVWNEVNLKGMSPFTSFVRVKLAVALESDPDNHRLLEDAAKMLTKKCRSETRMNAFDARQLRAALLGALEVSHPVSPDSETGTPAGRNQAAQAQIAKRNKSSLVTLKSHCRTNRAYFNNQIMYCHIHSAPGLLSNQQIQTSPENESSVFQHLKIYVSHVM